MNEAGRGMELSELVYYNNMLLTCDDRSGIIFEVREDAVLPRYILGNGDGNVDKGFKCEWMTVKDGLLYVGSTGKEWTNEQGVVLNHDPLWVKVIDARGHITSVEWVSYYDKMREATGSVYPGYLIHEAVAWHPQRRKWFVLPRRVSSQPYDDISDERRGSNTVLVCSEDFSSIDVYHIGDMIPSHGFSSVKFLPGRPDTFVVLKSEEDGPSIATYIAVFKVDGTVLLPETRFADVKYEGIEILP